MVSSTSAPHMRQSLLAGMHAAQKKWPQGVFTASKNSPEHLQRTPRDQYRNALHSAKSQ
jgi:hypothetical protein